MPNQRRLKVGSVVGLAAVHTIALRQNLNTGRSDVARTASPDNDMGVELDVSEPRRLELVHVWIVRIE